MAGASPSKTSVNALVPGHPRLASVKSWMPGTRPGMTGQLFPTMPAYAGDLDHLSFRRKARALRGGIQALGDRGRRRFADRAALLADQEYHRRVARVIVDAGEERVAALDAMHEALRGEKIERAIDGDRGGARPARRNRVDDLVGADRLVAPARRPPTPGSA